MERSLPVDSFSPGRSLGVGTSVDGRDWGAAVGFFGEGIGEDPDDEGDEGWGVSGRATYSFLPTITPSMRTLVPVSPTDELVMRMRSAIARDRSRR